MSPRSLRVLSTRPANWRPPSRRRRRSRRKVPRMFSVARFTGGRLVVLHGYAAHAILNAERARLRRLGYLPA